MSLRNSLSVMGRKQSGGDSRDHLSCLGPCSMRNVVLLKSEDGMTWLGGFSEERDYESLFNWAHEYSINVVKQDC